MTGVGTSDIAVSLASLLPPLPPGDTRQRDNLRVQEKAARARLGFDAEDTPASARDTPVPRLAAILGPLPPTAPLSVSSAFIELADLPAFEPHTASPADDGPRSAALAALPPARARVLVLTGPRAGLHLALEDQDATFLRGHEYGLFDRLRRTDIRYCPTANHLRLLLTVLNGGEGKAGVSPPSMVLLYDVLGLLMTHEDPDENAQPGEEAWVDGEAEEGGRVLRPGVTLSTYLEIVSAALDFARAVSEDGRSVPVLILEPHGDIAFPLLPPATETPGVPPAQRTRTFNLSDGFRRLGLAVGEVARLNTESEFAGQRVKGAKYVLSLDGQVLPFARRVGTKSEFACPPQEEGEPLEEGGWIWEWT